MRGTVDRVGLAAGGEEPVALLAADPHLLGDVGLGNGRGGASVTVVKPTRCRAPRASPSGSKGLGFVDSI